MDFRRQIIGPGFIGLFIVLLCAGSTWGSEAFKHELTEPEQSSPPDSITDNRPLVFNDSNAAALISLPSKRNATSDTLEKPGDLSYTDFSSISLKLQTAPVDWKTLPIIPELSDLAREILLDGIAKGNNTQAFSTIGDCQSYPFVFMGFFDKQGGYELASDEGYLQESIAHFAGSFNRRPATTNNGFSVANVLSPLWSDSDRCQPNENPLECEFRIHKPIVIFINLGTNWLPSGDLAREDYLREIIEIAIDRRVLPILSTKGDNMEGNHWINEENAKVASEYGLPLWNFWRSIQHLPQHGMNRDKGENYLSVAAWNTRSFSGLRMLHVVYDELMELQTELSQ